MSYHYSLIRFVPDPARGEFVNLGVIAGDDDGRDWDLRLIQNLRRPRALDDTGALALALAFAVRLEDHIEALEQLPDTTPVQPISTELLLQLSGEMQNIVQISTPTPVVADSAENALDLLFPELVVDAAAPEFRRFERKHRAQASTRRAYRAHDVPEEAVTEQAHVAAGPYEGHFDFAVSNGEVVQLVQCWSFQLPNQAELAEQVKAWAWVVRGLRKDGGRLHGLGDRDLDVEGNVEIAAVFVPPATGQEAPAFDEARAAFAETDVLQLTPEQADELGHRAASKLHLSV
jgi:hypothetical protein